jgi:integrase
MLSRGIDVAGNEIGPPWIVAIGASGTEGLGQLGRQAAQRERSRGHPFERLRDRKRAAPRERPPLTRDSRNGVPGQVPPYGTKGKGPRGGAGGFSKGHGDGMALPGPKDVMFGETQRNLINVILGELELKFDRDGQRRTAYSLRHTYISMRLMEGADIYQIAKNCRISVEMIEMYYASYIKNILDASAINVKKVKAGQAKVVGALTGEEEERAT